MCALRLEYQRPHRERLCRALRERHVNRLDRPPADRDPDELVHPISLRFINNKGRVVYTPRELDVQENVRKLIKSRYFWSLLP